MSCDAPGRRVIVRRRFMCRVASCAPKVGFTLGASCVGRQNKPIVTASLLVTGLCRNAACVQKLKGQRTLFHASSGKQEKALTFVVLQRQRRFQQEDVQF